MVSFLDRILGISRPVASKTDGLFAISTAVITLQTSLQLTPSNEAALAFKAIDSVRFDELRRDVGALLQLRSSDTKSQMRYLQDEYGYQWAILQSEEYEDLVTTLHMISEELKIRGFGEQLLSSVFRFDGEGRKVYWIYNYKHGKWYPFVPRANQSRDNAYELRLKTMMDREMPIEQDLGYWYPMWGLPI
jgi:hypothetical protein